MPRLRQLSPSPAQRGLTLVELMVTIAVAVILIAVALPDFSTFLVNTRIRSAAGRLQQDLQWARAEAIKENQNIAVTISTGSQASWKVTVASTGSTLMQTPPPNKAFQQEYPGVTLGAAGNPNNPVFNPLGTLQNVGNGTYSFSAPSSNQVWLVIVGAGGRIISCLQGSVTGKCYSAP